MGREPVWVTRQKKSSSAWYQRHSHAGSLPAHPRHPNPLLPLSSAEHPPPAASTCPTYPAPVPPASRRAPLQLSALPRHAAEPITTHHSLTLQPQGPCRHHAAPSLLDVPTGRGPPGSLRHTTRLGLPEPPARAQLAIPHTDPASLTHRAPTWAGSPLMFSHSSTFPDALSLLPSAQKWGGSCQRQGRGHRGQKV